MSPLFGGASNPVSMVAHLNFDYLNLIAKLEIHL